MDTRWLAVKQLDRQLKEWQAASKKYGRPKAGWIKTLRQTLCMTVQQLADRLGLSVSRIIQLEKAEVDDAVTLHSLRNAANAMGCDLVYAIVPKGDLTLEAIIRSQAEQVASEKVGKVAHTMALEKQSLDANTIQWQKDEFTKITVRLNKQLWSVFKNKKNRADVLNKFIQNLKKKK